MQLRVLQDNLGPLLAVWPPPNWGAAATALWKTILHVEDVANLAENPLDLADFASIWRTADFLADFYASVQSVGGRFYNKILTIVREFVVRILM